MSFMCRRVGWHPTRPSPPGLHWSLSRLSDRVHKRNDGLPEGEVAPGDYDLSFRSQALRQIVGSPIVRVKKGECSAFRLVVPSSLTRCSVAFERGGRPVLDLAGHVATFSVNGKVVEQVSASGSSSSDIWLPAGSCMARAWVGGFRVADTFVVIPEASSREVDYAIRLNLEDRHD